MARSTLSSSIYEAVQSYSANSREKPYRIVMHPDLFAELIKEADTLGAYAMPLPSQEQTRIWGIPITLRKYAPTTSVLVLGETDWKRFLQNEEFRK